MEMYFERYYHVYILSNKAKNQLITGITGDLPAHLAYWRYAGDQRNGSEINKFYLVYKERFHDVELAIKREYEINRLSIRKKHRLITDVNPLWDLLPVEE